MRCRSVAKHFETGPRVVFPGIVFLFLVFGLSAGGCRTPVTRGEAPRTDTDDRLAFYRNKVETSPDHYPSYALLADAQLRKARETGDPNFLAAARRNIDRSMAIQPNYMAMKTMAMISNYTHRFADALLWADKAAGASAEGLQNDAELTGIFVEAHLGLGEIERAEAVLTQYTNGGAKVDNFYIMAARAALLKAQNKPDEAVGAYNAAAQFAEKQNVPELIVWCQAMAAGCLIDTGRFEESEAYLDKGKAVSPGSKVLLIHEAEYLSGTHRLKEALQIYEDLLKVGDDPEMHRRAYVITRDLGQTASADAHWSAAEKGFLRILDIGEIYTLGPLAQLYCDRGTELEKAKSYALRNLEYKRDREAQNTLKCIESKSAS